MTVVTNAVVHPPSRHLFSLVSREMRRVFRAFGARSFPQFEASRFLSHLTTRSRVVKIRDRSAA